MFPNSTSPVLRIVTKFVGREFLLAIASWQRVGIGRIAARELAHSLGLVADLPGIGGRGPVPVAGIQEKGPSILC